MQNAKDQKRHKDADLQRRGRGTRREAKPNPTSNIWNLKITVSSFQHDRNRENAENEQNGKRQTSRSCFMLLMFNAQRSLLLFVTRASSF
jgi:hypothetical protein